MLEEKGEQGESMLALSRSVDKIVASYVLRFIDSLARVITLRRLGL
jgi:hypothetical protein